MINIVVEGNFICSGGGSGGAAAAAAVAVASW